MRPACVARTKRETSTARRGEAHASLDCAGRGKWSGKGTSRSQQRALELARRSGAGINPGPLASKEIIHMTWNQIISLLNSAKDIYAYNEDEDSIGIDGYLHEKDFHAWMKSHHSLTWTTDKPTKEGFYWHRPTGGGYAEVVRVFLDSFGRLQFKDTYFDEDSELLEEASGEWYGPIEPPTE